MNPGNVYWADLSWDAIQRTAAMCNVTWDADRIRVAPTRNGGTQGAERGWGRIDGADIFLRETASDEELGEAVRTAEARCQ